MVDVAKAAVWSLAKGERADARGWGDRMRTQDREA